MCSTAFRKVVVDPESCQATSIRDELTINIFVPDEFKFGADAKNKNSGGKKVSVYVMCPDGFYVPRFWIKSDEPQNTLFPTFSDSRLLQARPLVDGLTPRPLEGSCIMRDDMQTTLRDAIMKSWNHCGGAMLRLYCGGGKTEIVMASWFEHRKTLKGTRGKLGVLVCGLMEMWMQRCQNRFPDAKVIILDGKNKPSQKTIDEADIIIISMHMAMKDAFKEHNEGKLKIIQRS